MTRHPPLISLAALVIGIGACSTQPAPDNTEAVTPVPGSTSVPNISVVGASPVDLSVTSTPEAGSTIQGPLNQIILDFSAPVALVEVLVSGPEGTMPMMLSSAGVQTHYSIPVPGLTQGSYTLTWKATLNGAPKSGLFAFTIK